MWSYAFGNTSYSKTFNELKEMPIIQNGNTWGSVIRPWGYEIRVDFIDDVSATRYNEVLTFAAEPTSSELDEAVSARLIKLENQVLNIEVTNEDGSITQI